MTATCIHVPERIQPMKPNNSRLACILREMYDVAETQVESGNKCCNWISVDDGRSKMQAIEYISSKLEKMTNSSVLGIKGGAS